jgi:rare lipoprotein A
VVNPEDVIKFDNKEPVIESVVGLASYYSEPFHGRETSNGEIFDKYGLTAAHNSWAFNTLIKVTNLGNNKSINVRINDRMPKHPARIIDLSYGTALQLDMLNDGVVKVRLDVLRWGQE